MKGRIIVVRTVGVATVVTLVAIFVHLYGIMQANWLQYGLKIGLTFLPVPTIFFYRYSVLGYILPLGALLTLLIKNKVQEKRLPYVDVSLWLIGALALAWLLACILAWQLPLYFPVAVIR